VIRENLNIPLNTTLNTSIPIQGRLSVPINAPLSASVDVKNILPVKIRKGELSIPLEHIALKRVTAEPASSQAPTLK